MKWSDGKPYYALNQYYYDTFGEKTYKIALDIGTTCPNRDGTLSHDGCIYCSARGSGDFARALSTTTTDQISRAIDQVRPKYSGHSFIAYLQSFTNTYGDPQALLAIYEDILKDPRIKGLSIGTRPDCLDDALLDAISQLALQKPIWIELGLQSIHPKSAKFINRCYPLETFLFALEKCGQRKLPVVVHLIAGLPSETEDDFLESVKFLSHLPISGIKMHSLHVLEDTPLGNIYNNQAFPIMTQKAYTALMAQAISLLPPSIVIHRITGDPPKEALITPKWSTNKRQVLNDIHKTLKAQNLWQGKYYTPMEATYDRQ